MTWHGAATTTSSVTTLLCCGAASSPAAADADPHAEQERRAADCDPGPIADEAGQHHQRDAGGELRRARLLLAVDEQAAPERAGDERNEQAGRRQVHVAC